MKKCPYCAEEIQDEAIKCRYCGEMLTKDTPFPHETSQSDEDDVPYRPVSEILEEQANKRMNEQLTCPKCGCSQLFVHKQGFGMGKAVAGTVLIGAPGLLGGMIRRKRILVTCLKCKHRWHAGK